MFNKGNGGSRDRDLYVFCANASDGTSCTVMRVLLERHTLSRRFSES